MNWSGIPQGRVSVTDDPVPPAPPVVGTPPSPDDSATTLPRNRYPASDWSPMTMTRVPWSCTSAPPGPATSATSAPWSGGRQAPASTVTGTLPPAAPSPSIDPEEATTGSRATVVRPSFWVWSVATGSPLSASAASVCPGPPPEKVDSHGQAAPATTVPPLAPATDVGAAVPPDPPDGVVPGFD